MFRSVMKATILVLVGLCSVLPVWAGVERYEFVHHGVVAEGASFGRTGAYEKLSGTVRLSVDPDAPGNRGVVDLSLAPRDEDGMVRYAADIYILRPVDPDRGNGAVFLEICNRGGKAIVRYFNRDAERTFNPSSAADFGDGFLMRHGFTLVWLGWQHDVPDRPGLLRLHTVVAGDPEHPIEGLVRSDAVFASPTLTMALAHRNHRAYPTSNPEDPRNQLTVRDFPAGPRRIIGRKLWQFASRNEAGEIVPDTRSIFMADGFQPGRIYEAVYVAENPAVAGLGLTAIRDVAIHLKHAPGSPVAADRVLAIGISQTGRLLRHFLYQGFNLDDMGHRALDGVWAHTAGAGRGSFNHRFAQPSRDAHAFSAFVYPTDVFPFSAEIQTDPEQDRTDGLLKKLEGTPGKPRMFFTNTGYEYWGRAAGLVHTSVDGSRDLAEYPGLRLYHLASAQHFVDRFPPTTNGTLHAANPADFFWVLRSLLLRLDAWVSNGDEPSPSQIPRIANGELVSSVDLDFPQIPGVRPPAQPHRAWRVDYGDRFWSNGIVDLQPPRLGGSFPVLLPQVDEDGNESAGVRLPEISVPVATYTPWNLRSSELGGAGQMADFRGSFLPFKRTREDRLAAGDPRLSLAERYPTRYHYLGQYALAAIDLAERGFLLPEDLPGLLRHAEELWDLVQSQPVSETAAAN